MPRTDTGLILGAYAVVGFALAAALGAYVSPRTPTRLDVEAVALRGRGTPIAAFFTRLGYWPALSLLGVAGVASLTGRTERPWLPVALVLSHALAQAAIVALKPLFHRVRPDYWLVRREIDTSFPSGHAATAMTFYCAFALLASHARLPHETQIAAAVALGACAIGIPWSRLALGAHYLSDVAGGLLFGSAWLAASIVAYDAYAGSASF